MKEISKQMGAEQKIKGYKTLRGYIQMLKRQNKILTKMNVKVKFDVTLPMPE